jgi:hypothetical protein
MTDKSDTPIMDQDFWAAMSMGLAGLALLCQEKSRSDRNAKRKQSLVDREFRKAAEVEAQDKADAKWDREWREAIDEDATNNAYEAAASELFGPPKGFGNLTAEDLEELRPKGYQLHPEEQTQPFVQFKDDDPVTWGARRLPIPAERYDPPVEPFSNREQEAS